MSEYEQGWAAGMAYAEGLLLPILGRMEDGKWYLVRRVHDEFTIVEQPEMGTS